MIERLMQSFIHSFPLAQQVGTAPQTGADGPKANPPAGGIGEFIFGNPMGFMLLSLAMLYLMVILPQQRSAKKQQSELLDMLKNMKKHDRVITSSGIHGVIVTASPDSPTVSIRVDDATNAKITVNREAITTVLKEEPSSKSS